MTNQDQNQVICKSCNELTASSEMREVGDSAFCIPCFERLMALPVETEVVETKVVETPKVDSPSPNLSMYKCFVCNESMLGSPYKKMGNIGFCKECVDDLASYKAPESTSEVIRRKSDRPSPPQSPISAVPLKDRRNPLSASSAISAVHNAAVECSSPTAIP